MKGVVLLLGWVVALVSVSFAPIVDAHSLGRSKELSELSVSEGHWVYHGHFLRSAGTQMGNWVWNESCRWAANDAFMLCSFSNDWNGKHVNSIVVDTYNPELKSFWHFEIFNSGSSAQKPFAAKMIIRGNRRVESWKVISKDGKSRRERIVYVFSGANRVKVWFQYSISGESWVNTAVGVGKKMG
jgi:hypothetical protein